jgi:hypothetical protein
MGEDGVDPSEQTPEADLLEQQAPLDPPLTDAEHNWAGHEAPLEPVDEADRWEQQMPVPGAEDDYPHDLLEARWS